MDQYEDNETTQFYQERYDNTRMMFLGNLNIEVNKNSIKQGVELN